MNTEIIEGIKIGLYLAGTVGISGLSGVAITSIFKKQINKILN